MIKFEDLYVGQKLYYMYLRPTERSTKNIGYTPTLAKVKNFNAKWRYQVELEDPECGCSIMSELRDLYYTESEAREAWNSGVYNKIDYLRSKFEKEVKKLKKTLYDNGTGI